MIYHFDILASTNDEAAKPIYREGDIIWADQQSAGRGQRGHKWESRKGENITFTAIFEPRFVPILRQSPKAYFTTLPQIPLSVI